MTDRIAVIGGSGFVGRRLVARLLGAGRAVVVIDRSPHPAPDVESRTCDVRDREGLIEACRDVEGIINLAAEHRDDVQPVSLYHEVNVDGAANVCDAARAAGVRQILFTSSVAVYGFTEPGRPLSEDAPIRPFNDYGRTKYQAEEVYRKWFEESPDRSLVLMRPTVVFGEGNRGNVYYLIRQIAGGWFFMIGDGTNQKSMAYVENVAAAIEFSLGLGPGLHVFNYVDQPDYDMNRLVATIRAALGRGPGHGVRLPYRLGVAAGRVADLAAALLGRPLPFSRVRVDKFCASTQFASDRIRQLGFQPPVDLETALRRTVQFEYPAGARVDR